MSSFCFLERRKAVGGVTNGRIFFFNSGVDLYLRHDEDIGR